MKIISDRSLDMLRLYSWNNIFFKYFKKSIIYILLPLTALSLCIFYFIIHSDEEKVVNNQNRAFYQTASSLETVFRDVENNHMLISNSDDVFKYCSYSDDHDFKELYDASRSVKSMMDSIILTSQYISNVHLYKPKNQYVLSTSGGNYIDDFYMQDWYNKYKAVRITNFTYYNKSANPAAYGDTITIVRGLEKNGYLYGIIIYNIDVITMKNIISQSGFYDTQLVIYDTSGDIFFSNDASLIGTGINEAETNINYDKLSGTQKIGKMLFLKSTIDYSINIVSKTDLSAFHFYTKNILTIICFLILVLIISFIISFYLSLQYYQAIVNITTTLCIDEEAGNINNSETKYSELYYINQHMVSRFNKAPHIEEKLSRQIASLKKAQFVALQTQINPHFIYNTLNFINVLIMNTLKKDSDASHAIVLLSQLLRNALDTKKYIVTLEEELEYVKKYIALQRLKFNYNMNIEWDIDEALLSCKIVKFILQPIIENSFEHGFSRMSDDEFKFIKVTVREKAENIDITVTNNGPKIDAQTLSDLQQKLQSDSIFEHRGKGIGLVNVNHRIKLIYGEKYGLSLDSTNDSTTVHIVLPKNDSAGIDI